MIEKAAGRCGTKWHELDRERQKPQVFKCPLLIGIWPLTNAKDQFLIGERSNEYDQR